MFESVELGSSVSKKEYEARIPDLRTDLLRVQNAMCIDPRFAVVVVIAGVDGAGKGETVNILHGWMDPRYLETHAFGMPTSEEDERPTTWRFWRTLPPKGRVGIFFGSWYTEPILSRVYRETSEDELAAAVQHINAFESALVESGVLVLKFWFHISKKVQKARLKALAKDPELSWKVTDQEWKHFKMIDRFAPVCERVLRETSTRGAPWTLVEGTDRRHRELKVAEHLLAAIERRVAEPPVERPPAAPPKPIERRAGELTILDHLDLTSELAPKTYRKQLHRAQGRLNMLARRALEKGVSGVWVFEGWDAAGKGGAIRRTGAALDARQYQVVPIAAPTDEERAHPYLWRFWRRLPRAGHFTFFDRSWYGRVLVERVEGFATEDEWRRAYSEINEFESLLAEHGVALAKFWLHVSPEEQQRRFEEREEISYKQYKITEEDYRNREKWALYEDAVNEMIERTSTAHSPWTLVAANDKRWARVKVVTTIFDALDAAVDRSSKAK